ncbi:MAG: hypothetical protein AMXMBFR64_45830 [Myxococcales bacterium]
MIMKCEPGPFTRLLHESGLLEAIRRREIATLAKGTAAPADPVEDPLVRIVREAILRELRKGRGGSESDEVGRRREHHGPYLGPRGGKYADPELTRSWKEPDSLVRMSATDQKSSDEAGEDDLPPPVFAMRGDMTPVGPVTADMNRTQVERVICSSDVEIVVAFDSKGKQIFRATNNDPWSCEFDTDWIDAEVEDLVHNHPTGSCPSPGDILAQIQVHAKRHRVVVSVDNGNGKVLTRVWVVHCPPGSIEDWMAPLTKAEELARRTASGRAAETAGVRGVRNLERWKRAHPREWVATLNVHMLRNYTALGLTITEEAHESIKEGQPHPAEQQVDFPSHSFADAEASAPGAGSLRGDGCQAPQVARGPSQGGEDGSRGEFEGPLTRLVRSCFRKATPPDPSELPTPLTFTAIFEQLRAQGILPQGGASSRSAR